MDPNTCHGCVRARDDGGFAVPGATACLQCRRALSHAAPLHDRWVAGPPGGSRVNCDDRSVTLDVRLPGTIRYGLPASAAGLCAAWAAAGDPLAAGVLWVLLAGVWVVLLGRQGAVRHTWGIRGGHVRHTVAIGPFRVSRRYPAGIVRAFHCAGTRGNGRVRFHCGPYTVPVARLAPPPDNEWLMQRLNDRLAAGRRA